MNSKKVETRFLTISKKQPILEAIVYVPRGSTSGWDIFIVRGGIGVLFVGIPEGGMKVAEIAKKLSGETGLPLTDCADVWRIDIPAPQICLGCGRALDADGICPWLLATAKTSHGKASRSRR